MSDRLPAPTVGFGEAFLFWLKLGFINFGGPTGQIATMHQELVEKRRWISNERFLHALNYCMLLPGPEAQQLAVYIGWLLHRTAGGLVAGTLFIVPGFLCMLGLSWLYAARGEVGWVGAVFYGLRAAVIAIVAAALIRIGKKALKNRAMVGVAAGAFVAIFFLGAPFPLIVLGAGVLGFLGGKAAGDGAAIQDDTPAGEHTRPNLRRALKALFVGFLAWWGPLLLVPAFRGTGDVLWQEAVFFSKAAMVTFGGAYAVLVYIDHAAVEVYGWLEPGQMVTGLGLAESTPGPLILVTEFVGFLAAYRFPGGLNPLLAGTVGALVTTWATFAPCFLWIFLGAPFIEKLRGNVRLTAALSTITAAVVGVILNLAVWFTIHTLFREVKEWRVLGTRLPVPVLSSLDLFALAVALSAFGGLWKRGWGIVVVVLGCVAAGVLGRLLGF